MKRLICMLLAAAMLCSALIGCTPQPDETPVTPTDVVSASDPEPAPVVYNTYDDGRARPSSCGVLQVIDGKLCSGSGQPVMLRGVSSYGISTAESFINEQLFSELSQDMGVNVFRLAVYTIGTGIVGYCDGGDKERIKNTVYNGVEYAKRQDMYAIVDWHVLGDRDPNKHIEDAKLFFAEMAENLCDYNNVIYEICNEPNNVTWDAVKEYANVIIPIIRERDPDAVIIVGNPDWSKDLASVMESPLDFDNIMYTFHFYSATHKEEWRETVENASQSGLPIFVTEYGVTAASGGFPRDLEGANEWIALLERENISHCMWSFSSVAEACSALKRTVLKYSGYTEEDYTETGLWLIEMLRENNSMGNTVD